MKIIFWNIGKTLNRLKLDLLTEAMDIESPDVFCVAEGSYSKFACQQIIDEFVNGGYVCYYSPLCYEKEDLGLNYKYIREGLKVFVRKEILIEDFSFACQREDGRVILLTVTINYKSTILIFLHNRSKGGSRQHTPEQARFIGRVTDMITYGFAKKDERILLMGDFNLEPWDDLLNNKSYLISSFLGNHNKMIQRKKSPKTLFNPLVEFIFNSSISNLGGTYYSHNNNVWALFDYPLYNTQHLSIDYKIITQFHGGTSLLHLDEELENGFLNHDLDHLPILTKILD